MKASALGAEGKVGRALVPVLERAGHDVRGFEIGDEIDVRGSTPRSTSPRRTPRRATCARHSTRESPALVGTTGWDPQPLHEVAAAAGLRLFVAPNFSIGAVLMMRFAQAAAVYFPRAEIIELHNEAKKDAPSGTARTTAGSSAATR